MCHKALVILPPTDTTRFFRLYWGLNAYVNQKLAIIPKQFTADSFRNIPIEKLAVVRNALTANPELLHRYLAEDPHHLPPEDRDIVSSWRLKRAGQFVVVRHLKKYTVFLDDKPPGHLYGVVGLHSPIDEMLEQKPPLLVSTVLLPFCGVIVTDGLMSSTQVHLGRNIQENIRQHYNRIKLRAGITVCLDSEERSIQGKPVRRPAPDWAGEVEEIAARAQRLREAGEPQQRAALNLLRASAGLAQAVFHAPGERCSRLRTLRRAVTQIEQLFGDELWDL